MEFRAKMVDLHLRLMAIFTGECFRQRLLNQSLLILFIWTNPLANSKSSQFCIITGTHSTHFLAVIKWYCSCSWFCSYRFPLPPKKNMSQTRVHRTPKAWLGSLSIPRISKTISQAVFKMSMGKTWQNQICWTPLALPPPWLSFPWSPAPTNWPLAVRIGRWRPHERPAAGQRPPGGPEMARSNCSARGWKVGKTMKNTHNSCG